MPTNIQPQDHVAIPAPVALVTQLPGPISPATPRHGPMTRSRTRQQPGAAVANTAPRQLPPPTRKVKAPTKSMAAIKTKRVVEIVLEKRPAIKAKLPEPAGPKPVVPKPVVPIGETDEGVPLADGPDTAGLDMDPSKYLNLSIPLVSIMKSLVQLQFLGPHLPQRCKDLWLRPFSNPQPRRSLVQHHYQNDQFGLPHLPPWSPMLLPSP